jgi:hypothetical protein
MKPEQPQKASGSKQRPRAKLTIRDIAQLRATTMHSENTIRNWAKGGNVYTATAKALEDAAAQLGIEVLA